MDTAAGNWRFLQLTLFLGAWMLLGPLLDDRWAVQVLLQGVLLYTVIVTLRANPRWAALRPVLLTLWGISVVGSLLALAGLPERLARVVRSVELVAALPLLTALCVGILRHVFQGRRLTQDGLFATVAVYMLMALLFSQLYLLLLAWNPSCFSLPVAATAREPHLLQMDMLYYSYVTLATVEAIVGQFYVAVIVAVFVGMFASQQRGES